MLAVPTGFAQATLQTVQKRHVYPIAFNNIKLFTQSPLTNSGQACRNAAQGFEQRSFNGFSGSKMQNQINKQKKAPGRLSASAWVMEGTCIVVARS